MTPAIQSIITKGLSCGITRGCESGTMITAGPFSLFCGVVLVDPEVLNGDSGSGGGVAYNAGPISVSHSPSFPSDPQNQVLVPLDPNQTFEKRAPITLKLKWGETKIEKIYMVRLNKLKVAIKIINLINSTTHGLKVRVNNIKKINHRITIKIKSSRYFKGWRS